MIGIVFYVSFLIFRFFYIWQQTKYGYRVDDKNWLVYLNTALKSLGISKSVRIIVHKKVAVPAIFGVFKPILLIPETALSWSKDKRSIVVLHELAHVKRQDFLLNIFIQIVHSNPYTLT